MPIHDWTLVTAGTFHDFHLAWISEIRSALNGGLLPDGYYAMAEQVAGQIIPDILTLQDLGPTSSGYRVGGNGHDGGTAVATAPPRVAFSDTISEAMLMAARRRQLVIRHTTGDRIVALLEIVSQGNKEKDGATEAFVEKAIGALDDGFHLLIVDLYPPGPFDPNGIHGEIWRRMTAKYEQPADKPLTLAAYSTSGKAGAVTCYVEPTAVGQSLAPMPIFLDPGHYINVPLEETYQAAYRGVPERWKRVIEKRA